MADDIDRCSGSWSNHGGCDPNPCDPTYRCPPVVVQAPSCTALLHLGQWLQCLEEAAYKRGWEGACQELYADLEQTKAHLKDAHDWVKHTHSQPPYENSRERILAQLQRAIDQIAKVS